MRSILFLVAGVAIGFVVAHQVSRTPQGKAFFDDIDRKAHEFGDALVDGYRAREAELREALSNAEDAIADLKRR